MSSRGQGDASSTTIRDYMRRTLRIYEQFRGHSIQSVSSTTGTRFWDLVVITTADVDQSAAYRRQIASKVAHGQLPYDLALRIYCDTPANVKIGSGGSVLNALKQLHLEYGDRLYDLRILLICAGGQSQRLPTASVLGKLFLPLPICDDDRAQYHMLDLKLALYLPFLQRAVPGVFVTCSDDVETFCLPPEDDKCDKGSTWNFAQPGFTALGHVSSIAIGRSHGVYVLQSKPSQEGPDCKMYACKQVLQKPSFDTMKKTNALLDGGQTVCTDSVYFFDATVCKAFLGSDMLAADVTCEVDAYGDFLRPLGSDACLEDYVEDTATVVSATSTLASTRRHLFELLRPFPLHVVVPRRSSFHHVGTMVEYVENLTRSADNHFFDELNCSALVFSLCGLEGCVDPQVTVMHSVVGSGVTIGSQTVVEFCEIKGQVSIGHHCIVSNCCIDNDQRSPAINVPSSCCFHTIAIANGRFVTVAFGLTDDLKKRTEDLCYMGWPLGNVCSSISMLFDEDVAVKNLWTANLFPVADTMEESFVRTLELLTGPGLKDKEFIGNRISMEKALRRKDADRMIAFRERLHATIASTMQLTTRQKTT